MNTTLLIVVSAVNILLLLSFVFLLISIFRTKHSISENLQSMKQDMISANEQSLAQSRDEQNKNFSAARMENMQYFTNQHELTKNSFSDFIKFLQELQKEIQDSAANTNLKLQDNLQKNSDRNESNNKDFTQSIDNKFIQLKNTILEENRNSRQEQINFQSKFQENIQLQLDQIRQTMDQRLKVIQEENNQKLDEMKKTVDDKLQESMDKHFNESFKLISERLEQVHKGLGEMQTLATGVGDLRKALTNVKIRGNIGEIQLAALLEQYLAPDQYEKNKSIVPQSSELVEFAIRLPGHKDEEPVFLPIDSKFPVEDYLRLIESYELHPRMSPEVKAAQKSFEQTVRKCASDIKSKYIYPPISTAFALMFVPSEGIYAEILRLPGLLESLQNDYQISVVGPSNLVAFLNSLQMGFKTLAIEKHSNDVWQILGAVKTEFKKFGQEMESTRKSLEAVVNHVDKIGTRSRAVERKLRNVHALSDEEATRFFPASSGADDDAQDEV